jgi:hypothetical protein
MTANPRRLRRTLRLAPLLVLALAGCQSISKVTAAKDPRPCPRFATVNGAQSLTRFTGTGRDLTDVDFIAVFGDIQGECTYGGGVLDMTLRVPMIVERGPANQDRLAKFDYFVAVATTDNQIPQGGRQSFSTVVPFHGTTMRNGGTEEVEQQIAMKPDDSGANYVVYVGFVLTEDELKYNQANPAPALTAPPSEQ